jgi:hypothetical protein
VLIFWMKSCSSDSIVSLFLFTGCFWVACDWISFFLQNFESYDSVGFQSKFSSTNSIISLPHSGLLSSHKLVVMWLNTFSISSTFNYVFFPFFAVHFLYSSKSQPFFIQSLSVDLSCIFNVLAICHTLVSFDCYITIW